MKAYRLVKAQYADSAFRGARGRGRWNPPGVPLVYTADQPATALLETLVHVGDPSLLDIRYVLFVLTIDDEHVQTAAPETLPKDWHQWPWPTSIQRLGEAWYEASESIGLKVPSAVVPFHENVLINPHHPDFSEVGITGPEDFSVDTRLGNTGC